MNQSQIHLALTHIPVVLSITGLVILIIAIIKNNPQSLRTSLYILIAAGLFALPVFFSGEGAEEAVEHFAGVNESLIEKHEAVAKAGLWIILITALVSLAALLKVNQKPLLSVLKLPAFFLAVTSAVVMSVTAHLGGKIRHSEISNTIVQGSSENAENPAAENEGEKDDDD